MQLVDRGRVNMEDVASEIGISPDSLSASLAVMQKDYFSIINLMLF